MRIQDIMTRKVETITAAEPVAAAIERMRQKRIRHLVVTRDGKPAGIVSAGDLRALSGDQAGRVEDVMSAPVVSATADTTIRKAANLLRGRSIGCLAIMDGARLVGIVTTTDLLERIGRGAERSVDKGKRWILKGRGPRRKSVAGRKGIPAR